MENRVIGRGALAGLIAGVLGFAFAYINVEPYIQKAIDYEGGRGEILDAIHEALGLPSEAEGPEIFDRTFQSIVGLATGITGVAIALSLLVAVAFLLLHGRVNVRPRVLVWSICAFGFLGIFLLPFAKYPSNPPAIGHDFTIETRGALYLGMVAISLILLTGAVFLARYLSRRMSWVRAVVITGIAFLVVFVIVCALLPALGDLPANVAKADEFGFARAATETAQPITNILSEPLTVDGITYAPGQIIYQGFDADLLWAFRWYSILNQVIIWLTIALVFGGLAEKLLLTPQAAAAPRVSEEISA
ncbi:CbtA family protein [Propionicimonas sp.]|uniref:CbtA family protein n=1 Tax=Propionicimonas sp. TaxID=1955623 RepID=UPI0039E6F777